MRIGTVVCLGSVAYLDSLAFLNRMESTAPIKCILA